MNKLRNFYKNIYQHDAISPTLHKRRNFFSRSDFQEEPATVSALNDSELRALLDEAITYKRPKDREGKSELFKVSIIMKTTLLANCKKT